MSDPKILLVSDDPGFPRDIVARWQTERFVPSFTVMASELCATATAAGHSVAIVGRIRKPLDAVLEALAQASCACIYLAPDTAAAATVRARYPHCTVVRAHDSWLETMVLVASEVLRRIEVVDRLKRVEQTAAGDARHAAVGRLMLECRHGFNNALTSILGNAELALLEPDRLPPSARDQVETIHAMALRMHEMVFRITSLETELRAAEKASQSDTPNRPRTVAARA